MRVENGVLQIEPDIRWLSRGLQATRFLPALVLAAALPTLPVPEREKLLGMLREYYPKVYKAAVEAALSLQAIRN